MSSWLSIYYVNKAWPLAWASTRSHVMSCVKCLHLFFLLRGPLFNLHGRCWRFFLNTFWRILREINNLLRELFYIGLLCTLPEMAYTLWHHHCLSQSQSAQQWSRDWFMHYVITLHVMNTMPTFSCTVDWKYRHFRCHYYGYCGVYHSLYIRQNIFCITHPFGNCVLCCEYCKYHARI